MDTTIIVDVFSRFFYKGIEILLPAVVVSLVLVVVVAVVMAMMQIQEQSLTFVPKLIGFVVLMIFLGPWMFDGLITLVTELFEQIPEIVKVR